MGTLKGVCKPRTACRSTVCMLRKCRLMTLIFVATVVMLLVRPWLRDNLVPVFSLARHKVPMLQAIKIIHSTLSDDNLAALASCTELEGKATPSHNGVGLQHVHTAPAIKARATRTSPRLHQKYAELYAHALKWVNSSETRRQRFWRFLPQQTLSDKIRMVDTWRALHHACVTHDISYFLMAGSLLGAFRYRGLIPWDDDFDVAVDIRDARKLQRALACVPGYTLHIQNNMHWKFFPEHGSMVHSSAKTLRARTLSESEKQGHTEKFEAFENVVMRFPFVDIFLLKNDGFYVWALTDYAVTSTAFRVEDVYPLTVTYFEGYLAPVPQNSRAVIDILYEFDVCLSPEHDHKLGIGISDVSRVPCQELTEMYPIYNVGP